MTDLPESPARLRSRFDQLDGRRRGLESERTRHERQRAKIQEWLALEGRVRLALDELSRQLFEDIVKLLEEKLTIALQEVLEQNLQLRVTTDYQRNAASISFHVERDGNAEDIMKGMGGSVANVLSVGLRLFALTTLDEKEHRRFLVLDEQDCWLRPDLVPRFVKIIHDAARALHFQVLMISHHDPVYFEGYADRIIRLEPTPDGIRTRIVSDLPDHRDE
ncbi:MAG: DNA repair protein [Candidatus Sumerlaeia bacterium]|nr:DNA repair protein [Candidatus Sumerlaeia bacterium]